MPARRRYGRLPRHVAMLSEEASRREVWRSTYRMTGPLGEQTWAWWRFGKVSSVGCSVLNLHHDTAYHQLGGRLRGPGRMPAVWLYRAAYVLSDYCQCTGPRPSVVQRDRVRHAVAIPSPPGRRKLKILQGSGQPANNCLTRRAFQCCETPFRFPTGRTLGGEARRRLRLSRKEHYRATERFHPD
jgi:hypothetical protein